MKKGFTLIELLVVVAIIGLLASVVVVSLGGARSSARDARRIADISQLRTALELYAAANNSTYPATLLLLSPTFIPAIPSDPTNVDYTYCLDTTNNRRFAIGIDLEDAGSDLMGGSVALAAMPGVCTSLTNWSAPTITCEVEGASATAYCIRN